MGRLAEPARRAGEDEGLGQRTKVKGAFRALISESGCQMFGKPTLALIGGDVADQAMISLGLMRAGLPNASVIAGMSRLTRAPG